jgi:hypothetical protein
MSERRNSSAAGGGLGLGAVIAVVLSWTANKFLDGEQVHRVGNPSCHLWLVVRGLLDLYPFR